MILSGPQLGALFYLRDKTATGGAYAGNVRRNAKATTLRALYRLKLIASDCGDRIQAGTYVTITQIGRDVIANQRPPARFECAEAREAARR